ncbi:MAG: hypothetical protein CSA21_06785 [Deltaproteobacteria bacterium]|nr:MAG: hypothetical protein CSA21_06785 [Deltaproteobacteria bacterium]
MKKIAWWQSVIAATLAYYSLKYWLPDLFDATEQTRDFLALIAPISTMGLLLLAAKQLYDTDQKQQKANQSPHKSKQ